MIWKILLLKIFKNLAILMAVTFFLFYYPEKLLSDYGVFPKAAGWIYQIGLFIKLVVSMMELRNAK